MPTILAISGSLRAKSFNTMLLHAAVTATPSGTITEIATIKDIPLYDGDVEAAGLPAAVSALKERVVAADGLLLVSPEYNNGIPPRDAAGPRWRKASPPSWRSTPS